MRPIGDTPQALLIVDDDRTLGQMLAWAFEDLGYAVWVATTADEARHAVTGVCFDCGLVDYHLPDGDGAELGRWLTEQSPTMRIMLMSADADALDQVCRKIRGGASNDHNGTDIHCSVKPLRPGAIHNWFAAIV